jgi:hypothetical protein
MCWLELGKKIKIKIKLNSSVINVYLFQGGIENSS